MDEVGEAELIEAGRAGQVLDCAAGPARRVVDAALVRRCCHELKNEIDPRGIRLRNASVTGCLDLTALDVPFPLWFHGCEFDTAPNVEGSRLFELTLDGCARLPGLLANGLQLRRDLNLSRSKVTGGHRTTASTSKRSAIWLCEADIGGRLLCDDTVIYAEGERAIQADRLHVGGTVRFLHRFSARTVRCDCWARGSTGRSILPGCTWPPLPGLLLTSAMRSSGGTCSSSRTPPAAVHPSRGESIWATRGLPGRS